MKCVRPTTPTGTGRPHVGGARNETSPRERAHWKWRARFAGESIKLQFGCIGQHSTAGRLVQRATHTHIGVRLLYTDSHTLCLSLTHSTYFSKHLQINVHACYRRTYVLSLTDRVTVATTPHYIYIYGRYVCKLHSTEKETLVLSNIPGED